MIKGKKYIVVRKENKDLPRLYHKARPIEKKFYHEGYRLMSYDATYERTMFDFVERVHDGSRIIEVEDVNSGIRFIVEVKV